MILKGLRGELVPCYVVGVVPANTGSIRPQTARTAVLPRIGKALSKRDLAERSEELPVLRGFDRLDRCVKSVYYDP